MSGYRLDHGGDIDRSRPLTFHWEGKSYSGFAGDTLASALLASGVRMVGRSFKYHRPRGLIAAGLDEPNAIVQLEQGAQTIPNLKAPYVELYEGLSANPVNAWPSLGFDLLAVNGLLKRFIPAAFYYKTFMWPDWLLFEPAIRKAAGLGTSPALPDPDVYAQTSAHTDVLVVGGGIAGLSAALHAAQAGKTVMLVTGGAHWGGRLAGTSDTIEGKPARVWIEDTLRTLAAMPNVTLKARTLATGHYDHGMVALLNRVALSLQLPLHTMDVDEMGNSDGSSFRMRGIPTVTLHSVTWANLHILHSEEDKYSAIDIDDYYDTYKLIAAYLATLDQRELQPAPREHNVGKSP